MIIWIIALISIIFILLLVGGCVTYMIKIERDYYFDMYLKENEKSKKIDKIKFDA